MFFFHIVLTPFLVLKDPLSCLHILVKITLGRTVYFTKNLESDSAYLHTKFEISLYIRSNNFYFDGLDFFAVIFTKQLIV